MSGPSIRFRLPPASLFKFPPDPEPAVLPPPDPVDRFRSFAAPFEINRDIYNGVFSVYVPITIASVYAVTVLYMNAVNRERGGKPWAISRTRAFHAFVVVHNVGLAIFSGLVFWAMLRSLAHTWPSYREYPFLGKLWPGIRTQYGLAGAADALCKMHGPRGFGDAAAYSAKKGLWEIRNKIIRLASNGTPDPTDLGRLWNEGLAFWGWFFYLSKFYEVVDTAIIILKGKRSSTLQTYHHAGAMFCMWAGMRYMSPPIWMFVWVNAGVHTIMYTYYTLSALGFKVPRRLKKSITTMQISQFLIGITFAAGHLFVEYTLPAHLSYAGKHGIKHVASAVSAAAVTVASGIADPTATAGAAAWLKKLAYRAAGEEGLAENVRNQYGEVFGAEADHVQSTLEQMRRSPKYETVNCIDTPGQSFAIWLNLVYLAPLTWLFLRFFWQSYSRRNSVTTTHPTHRRRLSKSAEDAALGVERHVDSIGRRAENGLSEIAKKVGKKSADKKAVSDTIGEIGKGLSKGYDAAVEKGKGLSEQVKDSTRPITEEVSKKASKAKSKAKDNKSRRKDSAKDTADDEEMSSSHGSSGPPVKSEGQGDAGPEGSAVLVERHSEAAETSEARAEDEGDVASPPTTTSAGNPKKREPAPEKAVKEEEPQGLSTTDSTAPGAKSYADELK